MWLSSAYKVTIKKETESTQSVIKLKPKWTQSAEKNIYHLPDEQRNIVTSQETDISVYILT